MHPDMTQELPQIMKKVRIKKEYYDTITMYQAFQMNSSRFWYWCL